MLWTEAWCQVPCGSLPSDDALIAARIGMEPKVFAKAKAVLLRGWWLADDGRLYHPVITEFVTGMLKRKDAERQRKAEYRARMDAGRNAPSASVPELSRGTDAGRTQDSGGSDATGTGTSINTPQPPKGRSGAVSLKTWAEAVKAKGEKLIPEDDPVFGYADQVGIPRDYLDLAWLAFKRRYTVQHPAKRYTDWRRVFRNAVEGNWAKLWFVNPDGSYSLTTVGHQAQRATREHLHEVAA